MDPSAFHDIPSQGEVPGDEDDVAFRKDRTVDVGDRNAGLRAGIAPIMVANLDSTSDTLPGDSATIRSPTLSPLERELRTGLKKYRGDAGYEFLPLNVLEAAAQVDKITNELCRWYKPQHAKDMAYTICGDGPSHQESKDHAKRKIFAILVLMEKARKIAQFIKMKICDHQLPFRIQGESDGRFMVQDRHGKRIAIDMFRKRNVFDRFQSHQWEVLAPCFDLSLESGQEINHYDLNLYPGLPFVESKQMYSGEFELGQGGYAQVRRVKIHAAHYNSSSALTPGKDIYFAVKRLRRSEKDYEEGGEPNNHEAQVLKRLNDLEHQNIIRLLATFSYKGHFHMIFPWAKGNLQDFWKNHRLDGPTRAAGHLADWLCQQVIGLTDALTNVHDTQRSRQSVGILSTHSDTRTHGRHGDIKPENILWFDDTGQGADGRSLGVLKLADFGLADFHSEFSKSGANAKGVTGTYQAPEIDVVGVVSQKYDMWSLGCVLMEFVVWYVDGWEGVDNFSKRRSDETASGIRMDNFYDVRSVERATWDRLNPFRKCAGTKYRRATVKPSVAGIQKFLSEDPKTSKACSDFLLDLLDMIQDNLLRMDPDHQAGCDTIVRKIEVISKNCVEDSQYCTQLRRPIRKRHTHRSELCSSENSSYSHRRMDQNSIETDTEGAVASVCEMLTEDANLNERAHLMGDYSSNSSTEHRRHPLQKCFEYISRTLRKCLGFEDGRDS